MIQKTSCTDFQLDELIKLALKEDIGSGDRTTAAVIEPGRWASAKVFAKQSLTLAGLLPFKRVFQLLSKNVRFDFVEDEGKGLKKGELVAELTGPLDVLLMGERTSLNFLQHLSGIATFTFQFVQRIKHYNILLLDTRKTTPGWRTLEKEAVRAGGGINHRMGLFDGIIIKDNHIKACGSISRALSRARALKSPNLFVEIEVHTIGELREAIKGNPDMIMLDNMSIQDMKKAVEITGGAIPLEASGNITLDNIEEIARTGVHYISVGALTHSAKAADINMEIKPKVKDR